MGIPGTDQAGDSDFVGFVTGDHRHGGHSRFKRQHAPVPHFHGGAVSAQFYRHVVRYYE